MTEIIKPNTNAYAAAHMWIRNNYGTPQGCENCHTAEDRMYHWANISKEYKRKREDWVRLCVPCHKSQDIKALGGRIKTRTKMTQPTKDCAECGNNFAKNPHLSKRQWEATEYCSRRCSVAVTARKNFGKAQSPETGALKSKLLRERWSNPEYRERISKKLKGNKNAQKAAK